MGVWVDIVVRSVNEEDAGAWPGVDVRRPAVMPSRQQDDGW